MNKKTALITGGSSGVGLSLVKKLVQNNYFVYFLGSNKSKGTTVEQELNQEQEVCKFIQIDLSELSQVKEFTDSFQKEVEQLDLLANIAGVILPQKNLTAQGFERTFTIGYLAAFLLTHELLPILNKSKSAKIINMGGRPSQILKRKIDFDKALKGESYNPISAAFNAIHAKTLMTQALSKKLENKAITVNSFSPEAVKSDLGQNMPFYLKLFFNLAKNFMSEESETANHTALNTDNISGHIFIKKQPVELNFENSYLDEIYNKTKKVLDQFSEK